MTVYEDLIKVLRRKEAYHHPAGWHLCSAAADAIEQLQSERDKAFARLCEWCGVCPTDKRKPEFCEIANIGTIVNCKDCCADCQFIGCDRSRQCDIYVPKLKSRKVNAE